MVSIEKILTLSFTEAKKILGLKPDKTDLDPTDCRYICQYAKETGSDFVFITHFPSKGCPFNFMDTAENDGLCESFILLLDGVEIAAGGKKIHSFDEQTEKIIKRGLSLSDYSDFLELHKYALPPHGGCSIGLERLTMKLLNLENIKLARLFTRDMHHLSL
jgi:aspartyl/asparaginyl-tRNA synthetase